MAVLQTISPAHQPMNKVYHLTREIQAELVDANEKSLGESQAFPRGTLLTIVRGSHPWGNIKGIEYCTVQIGGKYFTTLARVLANSFIPKGSQHSCELRFEQHCKTRGY
jgi:hypothetical protein